MNPTPFGKAPPAYNQANEQAFRDAVYRQLGLCVGNGDASQVFIVGAYRVLISVEVDNGTPIVTATIL